MRVGVVADGKEEREMGLGSKMKETSTVSITNGK